MASYLIILIFYKESTPSNPWHTKICHCCYSGVQWGLIMETKGSNMPISRPVCINPFLSFQPCLSHHIYTHKHQQCKSNHPWTPCYCFYPSHVPWHICLNWFLFTKLVCLYICVYALQLLLMALPRLFMPLFVILGSAPFCMPYIIFCMACYASKVEKSSMDRERWYRSRSCSFPGN